MFQLVQRPFQHICYIFITMIIFLRVKWLQRLMMKPKDELCSIFWIVLVDLTGKFGHPSGNDHHVVDHIWNDNGQNRVDVGDVVGEIDHHNHGGFGEIVMTATSIADTTNFRTKSISITIKVMPHNMISTVTQLTWQKKFYRIYSAARVLYFYFVLYLVLWTTI